jgi:hypothetical protein
MVKCSKIDSAIAKSTMEVASHLSQQTNEISTKVAKLTFWMCDEACDIYNNKERMRLPLQK